MDEIEASLRQTFLEEATQLLENNEQHFLNLESTQDGTSTINAILRVTHSLKGSASVSGFKDIARLSHELESLLLKLRSDALPCNQSMIDLLLRSNDCLVRLVSDYKQTGKTSIDIEPLVEEVALAVRTCGGEGTPAVPLQTYSGSGTNTGFHFFGDETVPGPQATIKGGEDEQLRRTSEAGSTQHTKADESIRVTLSKLDLLINSIGELVILQSVLSQHKSEISSPLLLRTIDQSEKTCKEVQGLSMSLRMLPVGATFQKMQRIVRDTAKAIKKDILLIHTGDDTELDKTVLEKMGDPLVHLVRNAIDHGIETAEERSAAGKDPEGKIWLKAYHSGSNVVIEVADDGKGLDAAKLIAKAKEKQIIAQDAVLSAKEAYEIIFLPGFSTKTAVTDISGRGVGMDVVKTNISEIKGDIQIETKLGQGTCFRILLPLTLAIVDALIISDDERRFVIPLSQVEELVPIEKETIETALNLQELIKVRGRSVPLYRLTQLLGVKRAVATTWPCIAMIAQTASGCAYAIMVDDVTSQQQIIVKSLGNDIQGAPGVIGTTILGDGRPSLILDFTDMIAKRGIKLHQSTSRNSREVVA